MYSSPARPAGSAPPSFPSSSAPAIRSSGSPAPMTSADALTAAGAEVQRGTLDDLDVLRQRGCASDGVIHLAFKHDLAFSGDFQGAADADRRAVEAFGEALAGSDRPFVIASGTLGLAPGRLATERDGHGDRRRPWRFRPAVPRTRWAHRASSRSPSPPAASARPSCDFRRPITATATTASWPTLVGIARDKGVSGYIGDGANRWPAVHRLDSAHLFRLALENGPGGIDVARGRRRGRADPRHRRGDRPPSRTCRWSRSPPRTPASTSPGWPASSAIDSPASSALTRELLGWQPTHPGLIDDLDQGHYFLNAAS